MKYILFKHLSWAGQGQNKAPAWQQEVWGIPPFSLHWSQGVEVHLWRVGKGPGLGCCSAQFARAEAVKSHLGLLLSARCPCCPNRAEFRLRRGVGESGWPWWVGAGRKLASHRAKPRKAPFMCFSFYFFSTDPGLAGICLQPFLCISLFHICCAEIMMSVGSALITNTMSLVLL